MPAKLLRRVSNEGAYCHIYNTGVEGKAIFRDEEDYATFLKYLEDYLTPSNLEAERKTFTVKGRTFTGVPHQPKNYLGEVELTAFRLLPNRFDLLLRQISAGSLEKFMRSLSTRYSIFFNKKYKRTGIVFQGPYKSLEVKGDSELLSLSRELHHGGIHSSLPEYSGEKQTSWVNAHTILNFFETQKEGAFKEFAGYKEYVAKHKPQITASKHNIQSQEAPGFEEYQETGVHPTAGIAITSAVFLVLVAFGVKNIQNANASVKTAEVPVSSTTSVLSETTVSEPESLTAPQPTFKIVVKTTTPSVSVNVRQSPSLESDVVGSVSNGQILDAVDSDPEWYEVTLENGVEGFIMKNLAKPYQTIN